MNKIWRTCWFRVTYSLATASVSPSVKCLLGSVECVYASESVTDTISSRRPWLRSVQRSMQDSLSMVESWRKVIPGLSMIKLTPHRVSQIRFCALDTVAAAYSTLSRVHSHLSCWHHCFAITVSERENACGPCGGGGSRQCRLSVSKPIFLSLAFDFGSQKH